MALFLCPLRTARFYGGRVGQPSGWPGSYISGSPTLHVRHLCRNGIGGQSTVEATYERSRKHRYRHQLN